MAGYTVAVTADRRAAEQAELLRRRGAEVLHGAVIRTLPLGDEPALRDATAALIDEPPDVAALSTAIGVRGWFAAAECLGLGDALCHALDGAVVLARGPKAAGTAASMGLEVDWVTPDATHDELVARIAALAANRAGRQPLRVAVQLDGAGYALADRIRTLGVDVVPVPVYRWTLPEDPGPATRVIVAVAERSVDAVTFTSAHAVSNFAELAAAAHLLEQVRASLDRSVVACAVGPVTAARLRSSGLAFDPIQPSRPRLGSMVQALATALGARSSAFHLGGHEVLVQGRLLSASGSRPVRLTDREREVLEVLSRRPGAVVSKQTLLAQVWDADTDPHVVEVTIGRLRRRLAGAGLTVETVVRRGYRLVGE